MKRWKEAEKRAAVLFGVLRRTSRSGNWGISESDLTSHPVFIIEVKSRKNHPKFFREAIEQAKGYNKYKLPLLALYEYYRREPLIIMYGSDFWDALDKYYTQGGIDALTKQKSDLADKLYSRRCNEDKFPGEEDNG